MRLAVSFAGLVIATAAALYAPEIEAAAGLDVRELVVASRRARCRPVRVVADHHP